MPIPYYYSQVQTYKRTIVSDHLYGKMNNLYRYKLEVSLYSLHQGRHNTGFTKHSAQYCGYDTYSVKYTIHNTVFTCVVTPLRKRIK